MSKLCFLFGHRDAPESILPPLERAVMEYHVKYGFYEFVVGHHGAFDRLAARAVRAVQKTYPEIRLTLLLAYHPSAQNREILSDYDSTLYPDAMEQVPPRFALPRANQYMVGRADGFICYVAHPGNTRELLTAAEHRCAKHSLPLVNLAGLPAV